MTTEERAEMLVLMQEVVKPIIETQNVMLGKQDTMQAELGSMRTNQQDMQTELSGIKINQQTIHAEIQKINMKIEHGIDRAIQVTMEGHLDLNCKMDRVLGLEKRVETLEDKVSALEYVAK